MCLFFRLFTSCGLDMRSCSPLSFPLYYQHQIIIKPALPSSLIPYFYSFPSRLTKLGNAFLFLQNECHLPYWRSPPPLSPVNKTPFPTWPPGQCKTASPYKMSIATPFCPVLYHHDSSQLSSSFFGCPIPTIKSRNNCHRPTLLNTWIHITMNVIRQQTMRW